MNHVFDLSDPIQNAALMHLAQHHGYPTPLLDWTYSPFIAAFFAFNEIKSADAANADKNAKARIFKFDKEEWCAKFQRVSNMSARYPHLTVLEPLSIGNERLIPQRALSTFTTVDDIESYIQSNQYDDVPLLDVIDLPIRERDQVMKELRQMGITAGLLFPGIEGACQELKERFFRYATNAGR
jgi:FRG domain-containing protein